MEVKEKLINGIFWKGLERTAAQIVSIVVAVVLARILVPEDYSVVSVVSIFFAFCNLFISGGLNTALIQKKDSDRLDYSTVLFTNLFFAFVLYFLMFFCSHFISSVYDKPLLIPIIRVMGLSFFVNAIKSVLCAKITSDMEFKKFFFSTIIGTTISAFVGIFMAVNGYGAWALVAQQMTNSLVDTVVLAVSMRYHISIRFSFDRFKKLFSFGGKVILASFISTAYDECKPLIIGVKFSTADLAFYDKGLSFPSLINSVGNNSLAGTLFPAMSKVQDDKDVLLRITRRFIKVSSFIVFPLMAGLAAVSDAFVRVILTDKWLPIIPYMTIFCLCYAFDLVQIGNIQVIKAMGRSDILLKTEVIKKSVYFMIILVFVFVSDSPIVLAASSVLVTIWATVVNTYPTKKLLGYSYRGQLQDIIPNLFSTLIMFVVEFFIRYIDINMYVLLLLQVFVGVLAYIGVNVLIKNENLFYLLSILKERRRR